MTKPITTRAPAGEYSTVFLPDGSIETVLFQDDGSSEVIARTFTLRTIHNEHVKAHRGF